MTETTLSKIYNIGYKYGLKFYPDKQKRENNPYVNIDTQKKEYWDKGFDDAIECEEIDELQDIWE